MKTILKIAIYALMASVFWVTSAVASDTGYEKQKVVYHINYDNPKAQAGALKNIQNHINAVGAENLDLKVVLHGNGLALLLEPESLEKLGKIQARQCYRRNRREDFWSQGPRSQVQCVCQHGQWAQGGLHNRLVRCL